MLGLGPSPCFHFAVPVTVGVPVPVKVPVPVEVPVRVTGSSYAPDFQLRSGLPVTVRGSGSGPWLRFPVVPVMVRCYGSTPWSGLGP